MSFKFEILAEDKKSKARVGRFMTPHGSFETPCFMPCGTKGAVKTLTPDELNEIGCEIILGNTFHLSLRPGENLIEKMGGLHKWMNWPKPILTDSGGFQVFSLANIRDITDDGVTFQSPIDGSKVFLSPERSLEIQEKLGADIIMVFDECPPGDCSYEEAKQAVMRTDLWAKRFLHAKKRKDQAIFAIVQGATYYDLRKESAKNAISYDTPGIAIGGVAVGESKKEIYKVVREIAPLLPEEKPRYLMGVGEPEDIVEAVKHGIDMFDCVVPTRMARHSSFWDENGKRLSVEKASFKEDPRPLSGNCACYACKNFSRSYLSHLMREKEILGHRLLTIHNLRFLVDLVTKIRQEITRKS